MGWDKDSSIARVQKEIAKGFTPKVTDHGREMDFTNLGVEDVRRVQGLHVYADVPNFNAAVAEAGGDKQKQRKLLREASVLRKMQGDLLLPDGHELLQYQAARLHYLVYRPYGDEAKRTLQAVTSAITLHTYLSDVFNEVFDDGHAYNAAFGISSGESYVANVGRRGDRELISLGTCANLGAKILNGEGTIRVTEDVYKVLPDCLKSEFFKTETTFGVDVYQAVDLTWSNRESLKKELGIKFYPERLKTLTEKYRDELPLSEMEITSADVPIDFEHLTERNSKRVHAVTIYADLSGFTKRIQDAEVNEQVEKEVKNLHLIRQEFHRVIEEDFSGHVVQHQGDCVIALLHVPTEEAKVANRCRNATKIGIGIQSSMEEVLIKQLGLFDSIHVAIGIDEGDVLVTRLGKKGSREIICLGNSVAEAHALQDVSEEKAIRISPNVYSYLDAEYAQHFKKTKDGDYLASGLTFVSLGRAMDRKQLNSGVVAVGALALAGITVLNQRTKEELRPSTSKPWLSVAKVVSSTEGYWPRRDPERWRVLQECAHRRLGKVSSGIDDVGRATITGWLEVRSSNEVKYGPYCLKIVYPESFPKKGASPSVFLESHRGKWRNVPSSHIESDWRLCLFVPGVSGIDFSDENSLDALLDVAATFLVKADLYQEDLATQKGDGPKAKWVGEEYSHGVPGIIQAIRDRGWKITRNEPCLCGSGLKAKRCHYDEVRGWNL